MVILHVIVNIEDHVVRKVADTMNVLKGKDIKLIRETQYIIGLPTTWNPSSQNCRIKFDRTSGAASRRPFDSGLSEYGS